MLVKTLVGGLAAKVAFGVGAAAASVTAAGAAGVLPEPAHEAVAEVVAATTPFQLPERPKAVSQVTGDVLPTTTSTTVADGVDDGDGTSGRTVNHGACVSAAARDKSATGAGSHGKTVSSIARSDCGKTAASTTSTTIAPTTTSTTVQSTTTSTSVADALRSANSGRGNNGNGNGNGNRGNGNGNNGNGNNGNNGRGGGNPGRS